MEFHLAVQVFFWIILAKNSHANFEQILLLSFGQTFWWFCTQIFDSQTEISNFLQLEKLIEWN